jgi:DNA-directed RNA polymerase specialized sigma24 family protein
MFRIATNRACSACRRNRGDARDDGLADIADLRRTSVVATTRVDLLEALKQLPFMSGS